MKAQVGSLVSLGAQAFEVAASIPSRAGIAGHRGYRKFLILSSPRTGSNFLTTSLRSVSSVICFGEVLLGKTSGWSGSIGAAPILRARAGQIRADDPTQFLDKVMWRHYPKAVRAVGFKAHIYQLNEHPAMLKALQMQPDLRVIDLNRRNLLAAYVSEIVARTSRQYLITSEDMRVVPTLVELEISKMVEKLDHMSQELMRRRTYFPHQQVLEIYYEDLDTDYGRTMNEVLRHLDVPARMTPLPGTIKQNLNGWRSAVSNVSEVERALQNTAWEHLLHLPG